MQFSRKKRNAGSVAILFCLTLAMLPAADAASGDKGFKFEADEIQKIERLSRDRQWLHLLHLAMSSFQTKVLSHDFYLSTTSAIQINPATELRMNLEQAMTHAEYNCRFPAREAWLRRQFSELRFVSAPPCEALEKWRASLATRSLSIVYPNHSLESSLSVFSHTFIKFNSAKLPVDSNLNLALGFAAEIEPYDSLVKLAALGVFGGYVGKFSTSNYYEEVNRYAESESRDIFEYELNFTKEEINFLLDHVWEIQNTGFQYYFLNGNCSYYLLTLLEVARPDLDLTSHYQFVTIPMESVKTLVAQKNLVRRMRWITGKQMRQELMVKSLSQPALAFYEEWRNKKQNGGLSDAFTSSGLSLKEKVTVLDLLAESTRDHPEHVGLRNEVLKLRSRLPAETETMDLLPQELPQQSHGAQAMSLGAGYDRGGSGWAQLRYRFVLHNLLDPSEGYFRNTTLEVADLRVRYADHAQFENSSFTALNILALKPWTTDSQRLTWQGRSVIHNVFTAARWENSGGVGLTKTVGAANLYALGLIESDVDGSELGNFGAFAGASAGLSLSLGEALKLRGNLDHLWPVHSNHDADFWQGELQAAYAHSTKLSVQLTLVSSWREQSTLVEALTYF